jgi:hypothetical protein
MGAAKPFILSSELYLSNSRLPFDKITRIVCRIGLKGGKERIPPTSNRRILSAEPLG